ncbi:Predicted membrane protein [Paenibacillus sp. UNC496MF]|uniref:DUF2306 domain-containing protein n=1 Tax=Paenibacillus sp. UNC496MF TaxID=1502753 RepID=UPI0008E89E63|nr:DUF2306 domain-containing protein [Paenibacillus sp. UNC496MF]SFJ72776.1 Predicted membrane protein [Paenibacillus sp. UNC496MF]
MSNRTPARTPKTKFPYYLLLAVAAAFIAYAIYKNVLQDPEAAGFLRHKTNPADLVNLPVWLPVMRIHLGFACLALLTGAVNFSPWVVRRARRFHRGNGYAYLISVLAVSLSSGYMAPNATGGEAVSFAFNMLNIAWPAFTVLGILAIRKKRVERHRRWMARSYAFCFTNAAVHSLAYALDRWTSLSYEEAYRIGVYGGIALLLAAGDLAARLFFRKPAAIEPTP